MLKMIDDIKRIESELVKYTCASVYNDIDTKTNSRNLRLANDWLSRYKSNLEDDLYSKGFEVDLFEVKEVENLLYIDNKTLTAIAMIGKTIRFKKELIQFKKTYSEYATEELDKTIHHLEQYQLMLMNRISELEIL